MNNQTIKNMINSIIEEGKGSVMAIGATESSFNEDGSFKDSIYLHILFNEEDDVPESFDDFIAKSEYSRDNSSNAQKFYFYEDFEVLSDYVRPLWFREDVKTF